MMMGLFMVESSAVLISGCDGLGWVGSLFGDIVLAPICSGNKHVLTFILIFFNNSASRKTATILFTGHNEIL